MQLAAITARPVAMVSRAEMAAVTRAAMRLVASTAAIIGANANPVDNGE